ncbi:NACHT domain-containing protein [Aliinostoc sp. HNIBRCY26]|uniref:NACHT domain-containing protein n=1 Tax=Aliinostoc sp. HNIBRCY26 TaxID=3418997 RepID=UPI003CFDA5DA
MANQDHLSEILDRILKGNQTEADIDQLRRSLKIVEGVLQLVSQNGKFNTNIGKITGGDIHLGDRIYQGADAEVIKEALRLVLQETPNAERPRTEKLLLTIVKDEVVARIKQSLHNAVLINVGKEAQPEQVKRPWSSDIKIGDKPSEPIPDDRSILEVFDQEEIAGKLLILGNPGAGKTTTMLDLAKALIARAEKNADYPIPVLFNLSNWKDDKQSIREWLVAELKSKYGVRKDIAVNWLDDTKLLPMLDGLDELESTRQELCVQKINEFLQSEWRSQYLVVCSRLEEYETVVRSKWQQDNQQESEEISLRQEIRLHLNAAIRLQPLTNEQIQTYLASLKQREIWETLLLDSELLKLVRTPLFLSVLAFISLENTLSLQHWKTLTSTKARLEYLFDAYWEAVMTRELVTPQMELQGFKSRTYRRKNPPSRRQTRKWLVFLAQQLQRESQTEFFIEEMQPQIIAKKIYQWQYWFLLFTFSVVCTGIIVTTSLLPYFQPPSSLGIFWLVLVLGLIPGFILATESKPDGSRLILYPFVTLFCWLFKADIPREFRQNIPIMHKIYLSHRLRIRIPSFQELENHVLFPLRSTFSVFTLIYLMPIIIFIHPLHILIGEITYGLGFKKIGFLLIKNFKKVTRNTNLVEKQIIKYDLPYQHYHHLLLLTFQYLNIIRNKNRLVSNLIRVPGVFISTLACIFIMPFLLIYVCLFATIENSNKPNQGFYEQLNTALIIAIVQTFYILFLTYFHIKTTILFQTISLILCCSLGFSCLSIIKHLSLRTILWFQRYIPWNYACFLDYCTERLLLQRVGGHYRFIHKLLQEHFAVMSLEK